MALASAERRSSALRRHCSTCRRRGTRANRRERHEPSPGGLADLSAFPRALLHANPDTVWLHAFAMEIKEHLPWIASMLSTAVAFVAVRYRSQVMTDASLRSMAIILLAVCLAIASFVSLMGVFVNKVAPLQ